MTGVSTTMALSAPEAIAAAEEAKKKIIAGEIKVTDAMAQ